VPLTNNSVRDIEQYVAEQMAAPVFFPPFAAADKPLGDRWRYKGIYITDTSQPAWMDAAGTWRYADGTTV
jgi:hypothetical protein